jgi:DNA-binding NarL/FixJ family response regulator
LRKGSLLVSRYVNLLPFYKTYFESIGYEEVFVTDKDKDGLNMLINELKPGNLFMASNFYSIGTPYMVGLLHEMFPKLVITVVTTDDFPDELAAWFIIHGAKSYINFTDGIDEFKKGLIQVRNGNVYISSGVKQIIEGIEEWPDCRLKVTRRQKEVLFMICNGFSIKSMEKELQVGKFTVDHHIKELKSIFHVHTREELIKAAHCLNIVTKRHLGFYENRNIVSALPDWARAQIRFNRSAIKLSSMTVL